MDNFVTRAIGDPTNECIRVPKVYDWVTLNVDEVRNVAIPADDLILINTAIADGKQLDVTVTIDPLTDITVNVFNVTRRIVDIDGVETPIGCAQILKTATLHISVYDLGTPAVPIVPPVLITTFDTTLQFFERAGLCFPPEFTADNIIPHIRNAQAISLTSFPVEEQFIIHISICQDLQVETEVKLEVLARFCTPRDNNIDCNNALACGTVTFPEQCPNVYPVG